jgi:hypothetical protein
VFPALARSHGRSLDLPGFAPGGGFRALPDARQQRSLRGLGSVGSMLLAEDLLLLVTDDTSGRLAAPAAQVDAGLGGANLVELTLMNKVDLSGEGEGGKAGRIIVGDPSRPVTKSLTRPWRPSWRTRARSRPR